MATQEIPFGNGIKNISIPRGDAYIKIAKKNRSGLLISGSILSIANSIPSIFQIFSLPLFKFRTSFSGDNGEDKELLMTTREQASTRANRKAKGKRQTGKRGGDWEREGE